MQIGRSFLLLAALSVAAACQGGKSDNDDAHAAAGKGGHAASGSGGSAGNGGEAGGAAGQGVAGEGAITGQTEGTQPPSAYVAKVKRLINGGVATSDEIAMATADPASIKTLIDGWMADPGFERKMTSFFTEALQQGGNTISTLTEQMPAFSQATPAMLDVVNSMFARTTWDIVSSDRPFNEIATTRKFMVNTAMLVLLSFMDLTPAEAAKKEITVFNRANPAITPPSDLSDAAKRKVFQLPDAIVERDANGGQCADPAVVNHENFLRVLLGAYHSANCEPRRLSVPLLTEADLNDWRVVEFSQRPAETSATPYYDLPSLRKATQLALRQPRVGFFTTLAFFARNATNEDNDFRVTTNQTLIAAIGRAFDDEDVTIPIRTSALSAEHAVPGTVCWSCHISLDPMRNYFANDFLPTFRTPAVRAMKETSFGFRDITKDGGDLLTLAATVAAHPDFPVGWTQRLCYWANSQPCDEEDPEFMRVTKAFVASKLKFKSLVRELFASPLVTAAAETQTQKRKNGTIVSIARRSHLCADIANRLDAPELCKTDGQLSRLALALPDDEYGRGSVAPMQATEPTLMNSGTLNAFCDRVANVVVDGNMVNTRVTSSKPDAAFDLIVSRVMGLPATDPRYAPLKKIIQDHFTTAKTAKASATQAMRSAFSLACQSPLAAGIGL